MKKGSEITEQEFLRNYDPMRYERPSASIDCVIYTIMNQQLQVLLVQRSEHPFQGYWSLVGGYIDLSVDHDLASAAKRKLREKTGVRTPYLEQCVTVGGKDRDPRGWSITTVYYALLSADSVDFKTEAGTQATKWVPVQGGRVSDKLAFDHAALLKTCTERLRSKVLYTSLPLYLMPHEFTLSELQRCYETILARELDSKSFRRRILAAQIVEATGRENIETKRPAQIYRRIKSMNTHYFVRNIEGHLREEADR